MTLIIIFEKKKQITNEEKYFQLKSNLEKRVQMKFYKTSFPKTANFTKHFFCEQLLKTANTNN